ncbi:cAMP-dependent protein kinase catalytic subunit alpha-like [Macrosteles quadrilineatus]|uniref:cAMP-dependent protein kinase catalytic subunit alpha-like n=1 Tax=Macrosteles quadrilineatus TaxID=74068 RepID=UPI0023E2FEFF|nr:cAMP-dependent protein kinase catalytic subunit alpha-like [Macrosteles quadrilineatus]
MHPNQITTTKSNINSSKHRLSVNEHNASSDEETINKVVELGENETLVLKAGDTNLTSVVLEENQTLNGLKEQVTALRDAHTLQVPLQRPLDASKRQSLLSLKNQVAGQKTAGNIVKSTDVNKNNKTIEAKPQNEHEASVSTKENIEPKYGGYQNGIHQLSKTNLQTMLQFQSDLSNSMKLSNENEMTESSRKVSSQFFRTSDKSRPSYVPRQGPAPQIKIIDSAYRASTSTQSRKPINAKFSKTLALAESTATLTRPVSALDKLKATERTSIPKAVEEFHEEFGEHTYVRAAKKLSSCGPLKICDLDDFLKKSKTDFEHLYTKKPISSLQITDFSLTKTLGVGAFGKVVLAELKKNNTLYAVKIIEKVGVVKRNHVRYVSNEKRILQALNFPFVISLKYFFTDLYYLYFVMPYVPGGSFHKHLKVCRQMKESDAKFYIGQMVLALEYLHHLELIHRDVKTDNIMIDAFGYLKLVDFGQCVRCSGTEKTWTFTGTPEYMAPEIIVGKGYDCAVDWWALGIIIYELCAGYRPFKHENPRKLQLLILCKQFSLPNCFSRSLKKLIESLLMLEPKKRIANRIKKASVIKKHVWFANLDWLALLNRTVAAPYLPNLNRSSPHQQS